MTPCPLPEEPALGLAGGGVAPARRLDGAALPRAAGGLHVPRGESRRGRGLHGRRAGARPARAEQRVLGGELLAHPDPALRADGRGALPYRPRGESHRRDRAVDPAGPGAPRGDRRGCRDGVLGDLRLDDRHHRDARQPDGAGDARARLSPRDGDWPGDGDRRGRHVDPAVGADGAGREPVRDFDLQAPDRRGHAGADPVGTVRRLHRGAREARSQARAAERARRVPRLGEAAAVPAVRGAPRVDLRSRRRFDVGALATVVLALAYRALTPANLLKALRGAVGVSGMILCIIVGATTFSQILSFSGASSGLVRLITEQGLPPLVVIAAMMLFLIFLGVFVDQVSMMLITLPIFMPIVQTLGVDLVWFGVMFLICMQLGLLLPPHGLLLMTMKGVAPPQVTMAHIFRGVVPYVAMSIVVLAFVFFVPAVAVWLPKLLG